MTFAKTLFTVAAALMLATIDASAQVPVQTAPAKVGAVNTATFTNPTGGITRLVNALKTLDAEFKPTRDEITRLVTRLEDLGRVPPNTPAAQIQTRRDQAETVQIEIRRKQEDARTAYAKRFSTLTDPIRQNVFNALQAYAKQRGIDVLIDVSKFPDGVLLLNQNADITPGFIRDFNSKNP